MPTKIPTIPDAMGSDDASMRLNLALDLTPGEAQARELEAKAALRRAEGRPGAADWLLDRAADLRQVPPDANLQRYHAEYEALPTLAEAAQQHAATIAAEERNDSVIQLADWRLDSVGKLRKVEAADQGRFTFTREAIAISQQAFGQIQGYYPHDRAMVRRANGRYTAQWPSDQPLPASPGNLNGWLGELPRVDEEGVKIMHRVRARTHRGQREVFAVFASSTRGYTAFDTDRLLARAAQLQPNLKVRLVYDADTTRIKARAIAQMPIDIPAFVGVGRAHQIGFDLRTTDDGSMSLQCQPILVRIRGKNASLVQVKGKRHAFRHVGKFESLQEAMTQALAQAAKAVDEMRNLWAHAATEYFRDSESGASLSVKETFTRLVLGNHVPLGGFKPEEAIEAYMAAWRAEESPVSAQGIIMALQRAAHESSWKTKWAEDDIEAAASGFLYRPASWRLAEPEREEAVASA